MTNEMVERVAKALHPAWLKSWDEQSDKWKDRMRHDAKKAIAAMREPTEDMMVIAEVAVPSLSSFEDKNKSPSYKAWQAMIDRALQDE